MKKVLISGSTFLGLLLVHLLAAIVFLFVEVSAVSKSMWLCVLLLLAGIALSLMEMFMNRADSDGDLTDSDLGRFFVMKNSISSVLAVAGCNTFLYVLNIFLSVPKTVFGVAALVFALVCVINVITMLFAQQRSRENEDDFVPEEPVEEQI